MVQLIMLKAGANVSIFAKNGCFFLEHKDAVAEKPNALNCARVSSFHFVEKRICKVFVISSLPRSCLFKWN